MQEIVGHPSAVLFGIAALFAVGFIACAEGAASYEEGQREKRSAAWLESQSDLVVCRNKQSDLGYTDELVMKIRVRDEKNGEQRECHDMLKADPSALNSAIWTPINDSEVLRLGAAAQWMRAHADVHQCVQAVTTTPRPADFLPPSAAMDLDLLLEKAGARFVVGRWFGAPDSLAVVVRNCDKHFFFVTNADIPAGTPACGQADIPPCGTAAP